MMHPSLLLGFLAFRPILSVILFLVLPRSNATLRTSSQQCATSLPLATSRPSYAYDITTTSEGAQAWFNQALVLAYAFNHDEALRSLHQAIDLGDPDCVLCYVFIAYCHSPNINRLMTSEALAEAQAAALQAMQKASLIQLQEVEKGMVNAMALRFPPERNLSNGLAYDLQYAESMGQLADQHPYDADVLSWYAEAAMDTMAWKYYDHIQNQPIPRPLTTKVIDALHQALAIQPTHPLALHLLIHILEPGQQPEQAVEAGELLRSLPMGDGFGHLVHMPGHIFSRVGRYHEASTANTQAIELDRQYFTLCNITTTDPENYNWYYRALYFTHKHAFLIFSAGIEGRAELSRQTCEELETECNLEIMATHLGGSFIGYTAWKWLHFIRFGQWEEILQSPMTVDLPYTRVMYAFARSMAYAALGECDCAIIEAQAFMRLAANETTRDVAIFLITAGQAFDLASHLLQARLAAQHCLAVEEEEEEEDLSMMTLLRRRRRGRRRGDDSDSFTIIELRQAVNLLDHFPYMEPPFWPVNIRACLGQALLDEGRWTQAEEAFIIDLERWPENGWSLKGFQLALMGQGRLKEAHEVQQRFEAAWRYADEKILDRACF